MMLVFTNRLLPLAYIVLGALALIVGASTNAQGCHGGKGHSHGGMSGGYMVGGYSAGYAGGGYSGGMTGSYRGQSAASTASQNYSSPQQAPAGSANASLNNPATVLAYESDLELTSKQTQALEKMLKSGKQRAALVLTQGQRKQLAQIVGLAR